MGLFSKVKSPKSNDANLAQAVEEAPQFERVTWWREPGLRSLGWYAFILSIASASTGYDGMLLNSIQNFDSWRDQFGIARDSDMSTYGLLGFLVALYQIGSVVSIPIVPFVLDRWGRKWPIIIGAVITTGGAVLQAFCHTLPQFMGGRFLLGFGNSFSQMASPMLLTEIAHPQHRARLTTVYNCLWNVGAVLVAWTAFGTDTLNNEWSWRIPAFLQSIPSIIQLLGIYWVPESPRFLIANDRDDEALQILAKYHANGDTQNATVQFEFREIRETIKMEQAANKHSSYMDFFRTPGNRYRLMILISLGLFSQWSGNAIISNYSAILYENAGITDSTARLGLSAGNSMLAVVVSITCAMLVDRFGRRPIFLIATGGMLGTLIIWCLSCGLYEEHRTAGSDMALVFFIWLFGVFYAIAWSGLLIGYALEILTYQLRAKGMMVLNLVIQLALTFNNLANAPALKHFENHTWKLYLIYTFWVAFEFAFVFWKYVETRGPTLEELAKVIDGPNAAAPILNLEQIEKETHMNLDRPDSTEKTAPMETAASRV
ncbi:hypothetical protein MCOR25_000268 [Pyricularia grisea]|nr:hypothetical protein MCOR25_000268 [Pyricularia grisea]